KRFVEKAYANTQRLNTLLADLIDISRIESGEMRLSFRYFNIADVIRDVAQSERDTNAVTSAITIYTNNVEQDVSVFGDKERITQVLTNLISNAVKYNKPNGTVHIVCKRGQHETTVTITDTGIGIDTEHQPRIFERFYRADTNRSRSIGGSGLGLAIVKHILEAHNSTITLHSELDKGTTISFTLKN
ncbi:MAG: ATP-binding protein, partial [Candidatus Kapabacteria bacterium]|nr:ATP-binding protein [Candidatus Kapabacteria bacterium]